MIDGLPSEVAEAIVAVSDLDSGAWYDNGGHFTCTEADAVAGLLTALGLTDHAEALLQGHAEQDDEDDDVADWHHYDEASDTVVRIDRKD